MIYRKKVEECVNHLKNCLPYTPKTVVQLGTGLGGFVQFIDTELVIPYQDLPNFPQSTVESHQGNLVIGKLHGHPVAVLQGRVHFYEGYSTKEITFPIRVMSLLGVENLIITNAAGGLNLLFPAGTIMIIKDHLNFLGENPLRGSNVSEWGPRFPDLSTPYFPPFIKYALDSASVCNIQNVITGTYVCVPGPSLETPAETRWLRDSGADAVGMSSVPEAIVAVHCGIKVLGLSVISNVNDPDNFRPILLQDVIETANKTTSRLETLISEVIKRLPPSNAQTNSYQPDPL